MVRDGERFKKIMSIVARKFAAKYLGVQQKSISILITQGKLKVDQNNKLIYESVLELEKEFQERKKIKSPVWIPVACD